jgi:hypothetical protein
MKTFFKIMLAGIAAFAALCLLFVVYQVPTGIQTLGGPTDWVHEPNKFYSYPVEGWGYGKMNNEGHQNINSYTGQAIDILVMGSSQMEALQVPQTENTVSLLNTVFRESKYIYNVGKGGHAFPTIVKNSNAALNRYHPKDYLVMEIGTVQYDTAALQAILDNRVTPLFPESNRTGIRAKLRNTFLKELSFIRILVFQIQTYKKNRNPVQPPHREPVDQGYIKNLDMVMRYIQNICAESGVRPLIFYQPHLALRRDGSAVPETDAEYLEAFKNACAANNVAFLDMTGSFMQAYQNSRLLPHGFFNSATGKGHLNKHGHKIIAQELYNYIMQEDAI